MKELIDALPTFCCNLDSCYQLNLIYITFKNQGYVRIKILSFYMPPDYFMASQHSVRLLMHPGKEVLYGSTFISLQGKNSHHLSIPWGFIRYQWRTVLMINRFRRLNISIIILLSCSMLSPMRRRSFLSMK